MTNPSSKASPADCRNLVIVIEELLDRRNQEMSESKVKFHIWSRDQWRRDWKPSELRDMVYSSYPALKSGKLKRPPSRTTVMEIADYLECNLEERNRLLVTAQYAPAPLYLQGDSLKKVVNLGTQIAEYLPLPAYIINRDWNILFLNDHILKLVGITLEEASNIEKHRLNILHLILDPDLPLYKLFIHDKKSWDYIARRNIYGFKVTNALSQYDDWFIMQVKEMMKLPLFRELWNEVQIDWGVKSEQEFPYYITEMKAPNNKIVRFRSLLTSLGNYDYPQIVSYVPVDSESQAVFTDLSIPTPENRWGFIKAVK